MAKRIGELLVEAGVLSQSQLEQALFAQRKDGRKLGQLLIELGLVLFLLTFILNGLARILIVATSQRGGSHS